VKNVIKLTLCIINVVPTGFMYMVGTWSQWHWSWSYLIIL